MECNVDKATNCCCSSVNGVSPGWGCDHALVDEIARELQQRVGSRGMTGQLQKTEQMMDRIVNLESKIDSIDKKLDLVIQSINR